MDLRLPRSWKRAIIVPIAKKGKDATNVESYRPISLTSCFGKIAERMVNERLVWIFEAGGLLAPEQAGFRQGMNSIDQVNVFVQEVADGFQRSESTYAVFLDLQQAYDRVWRPGLYLKLRAMGVLGRTYRWIQDFLSARTICTRLQNRTSGEKVLEQGLPQGSALSCTLFMAYINDLPSALRCRKLLYADDIVLWKTGKEVAALQDALQHDLHTISSYCEKWHIKVSTTKTVWSLFSLGIDILKAPFEPIRKS